VRHAQLLERAAPRQGRRAELADAVVRQGELREELALPQLVPQLLDRVVGLSVHSRKGCQIGYTDRTGCHQLVFFYYMHPPRVVTLPGVNRLVASVWTISAVIIN
jgi:hypothetical protein